MEKKTTRVYEYFTDRKHFIRRYQRNGWIDFSELRAIDSLYNKGTNTSVLGSLAEKDGLSSMGT